MRQANANQRAAPCGFGFVACCIQVLRELGVEGWTSTPRGATDDWADFLVLQVVPLAIRLTRYPWVLTVLEGTHTVLGGTRVLNVPRADSYNRMPSYGLAWHSIAVGV